MRTTRWITVLAAPFVLMLASLPAFASDAQCMQRFKTLVADGNPEVGPVRIHVFQEVGGSKTENYFHSPGGSSGDGMMQPLKNMGDMWVLFRDKKMYTSMDAGETWTFGRDMDDAAQPGAQKEQVRKDLSTADQVLCTQEMLNGLSHDTIEGQYASTALQGAVTRLKYWVHQDTGFITQHESRSKMAGTHFYVMQVIEKAPELELPNVE